MQRKDVSFDVVHTKLRRHLRSVNSCYFITLQLVALSYIIHGIRVCLIQIIFV